MSSNATVPAFDEASLASGQGQSASGGEVISQIMAALANSGEGSSSRPVEIRIGNIGHCCNYVAGGGDVHQSASGGDVISQIMAALANPGEGSSSRPVEIHIGNIGNVTGGGTVNQGLQSDELKTLYESLLGICTHQRPSFDDDTIKQLKAFLDEHSAEGSQTDSNAPDSDDIWKKQVLELLEGIRDDVASIPGIIVESLSDLKAFITAHWKKKAEENAPKKALPSSHAKARYSHSPTSLLVGNQSTNSPMLASKCLACGYEQLRSDDDGKAKDQSGLHPLVGENQSANDDDVPASNSNLGTITDVPSFQSGWTGSLKPVEDISAATPSFQFRWIGTGTSKLAGDNTSAAPSFQFGWTGSLKPAEDTTTAAPNFKPDRNSNEKDLDIKNASESEGELTGAASNMFTVDASDAGSTALPVDNTKSAKAKVKKRGQPLMRRESSRRKRGLAPESTGLDK